MSKASSSKKCALCGKPASDRHSPFCSQGCRDRDLLQWLGEGYRVAGPPADESAGNMGSDGLDIER
jgi:endogenous inhibitor of DNA gyrase (YacG/DUF329 family)